MGYITSFLRSFYLSAPIDLPLETVLVTYCLRRVTPMKNINYETT
jgi:hypothetical protein